MKRLVLLGASGSIGKQTIDVVRAHPQDYCLRAVSVGRNIAALREILQEFTLDLVCVGREEDAAEIRAAYPGITVCSGDEGLKVLASCDGYDVLVNALVGFAGLAPTVAAMESGHDVALANKETLVVGGELIDKLKMEKGVRIYPIDSEHSAIDQCLRCGSHAEVSRLIITASGGSFRNRTREELKDVTVEEALAHPNWSMGAKITIDSATMMNKGFEVIEAHWLFDMPYEKIDVLMHDESVIHSMVEFTDHAVIAQLGVPDMRIPIQYALSQPARLPLDEAERLDLAKIGTLHFRAPDTVRYPLLALAYETGRRGGILPAVMNAANEEANLAFRNHKIGFTEIEDIVINAVYLTEQKPAETLEDLREADHLGREYVRKYIESRESAE